MGPLSPPYDSLLCLECCFRAAAGVIVSELLCRDNRFEDDGPDSVELCFETIVRAPPDLSPDECDCCF